MFAICIGMHRITVRVLVPHRFDARLEGSFRVGMVTSPSYNNGGQFFFSLSLPSPQCKGICRLIPVTSLGKQTCGLLHPFILVPRQAEVIWDDMPFPTPL